jgi:hypothetical protein
MYRVKDPNVSVPTAKTDSQNLKKCPVGVETAQVFYSKQSSPIKGYRPILLKNFGIKAQRLQKPRNCPFAA